jgi:hypothetical protein
VSKREALATLLIVAAAFAVVTLVLRSFNVDGWQNLGGIAGVLFFAFFALVIGVISKKAVPSIIGSLAITALIMAYVYPAFAIAMGILFVTALGLTIAALYLDSRSSYNSSEEWR